MRSTGLASTDTSITQSEVLLAQKLETMEEQIEINDSEIRKLWGVSYDTNKKAIAKNADHDIVHLDRFGKTDHRQR